MERYLKTFGEIINEAQTAITASNKYLPLLFNTREMRYAKYFPVTRVGCRYPNVFEPTITILDKKKFDEKLIEYVTLATDFYEHDKNLDEDTNPIKYLLYHTLSYTLLNEFDDIKRLFEREIEFIQNERLKDYEQTKNIGYIDTLCGNLVIGISKENVSSSTPWSIHVSLERVINNKLYYYDFPCVRFGISKSVAYIFDIEKVKERENREKYAQDKEYIKELESYQTSIKNLLNTAIKTKEIDNLEVISLTTVISLLRERGIKEILVPTVYLNRSNGLEVNCYQNIVKLNKVFEEAQIKKEPKILEETLAKISTIKHSLHSHKKISEQKNIRLIKSFKYLEEIFSDYKVFNLPMQKDTNMYFSIIPNGSTCKNKLLEEIDHCINIYEDMQRKLKDAQ